MIEKDRKHKAARRIVRRDPEAPLRAINEELRRQFGRGLGQRALRGMCEKSRTSWLDRAYRLCLSIWRLLFGRRFWTYGIRTRQVVYGALATVPVSLALSSWWSPGLDTARDLLWVFGASAQILGALFAFVLVVTTFLVQTMQARVWNCLVLIREDVDKLSSIADGLPERLSECRPVLKALSQRLSSFTVSQWPHAYHADKQVDKCIKELTETYGARAGQLSPEDRDAYESAATLTVELESLCNKMRLDTDIQSVWLRHGLWSRPLVELAALTLLALGVCVGISTELHLISESGTAVLVGTALFFLYLVMLTFLNLWSTLVDGVCRNEVDLATFADAGK